MIVDYRSFTHVERLDRTRIDVDGFLDGYCWVFPKLDGTSSAVWASDGRIHAGSRKREITPKDDNARFADYILNFAETEDLRQWCLSHEGYILYMEWLGHAGNCGKFVGNIKSYLEGGAYVFAVFDVARGSYVAYDMMCELFSEDFIDRWLIPPIKGMYKPSLEQVQALVDECDFNLEGVPGEGIVIYNYDYRDQFGNLVVAKIVRDEYQQNKSKPQVKVEGCPEDMFCDVYLTDAFLSKCRNKVCQALGADEFDTSSNKFVGFFMNLIVTDAIDEEVYGFVKKNGWPKVDFAALRGKIQLKGRKFLGL